MRGYKLPLEEEARRQRAYQETANDRDASEWLGMSVGTYRSWRMRRLPIKRAPQRPPVTGMAISFPQGLAQRIKADAKERGVGVSAYVRAIVQDWYARAMEQAR